MRALPYFFLILAGGLSLAVFFTSTTLAAETTGVACANEIWQLL